MVRGGKMVRTAGRPHHFHQDGQLGAFRHPFQPTLPHKSPLIQKGSNVAGNVFHICHSRLG